MIEVEELSFEKSDTRTGMEGLYFWVLIALVGGVLMLFMGSQAVTRWAGLGLAVLACAGYIAMLACPPKPATPIPAHRYFWLDRDGVHHVEGGPTGRTAHFTWDEIRQADAAPPDDDFAGLILVLDRPGLRGVPILLPMDRAEEAAAAIRPYIRPA